MRKPIANPDLISILVLTRGRPQPFTQMLATLSARAARKDLVDMWVYVDDDDPAVPELIAADLSSKAGFPVHFLVRPRPVTHGAAFNELWATAHTNAGIYFGCPDDYLMLTEHWDERMRETFDLYPDRLALGQVIDVGLPQALLIMAETAQWVNAVGYFIPPYFPFWFGDNWLEEIGDMVQRRIPLNVEMQTNGEKGKTQRLRDLPFWYAFFKRTLPLRVATATDMRKIIYTEGTDAFLRSQEQGDYLAERYATCVHTMSDDQLLQMQAMYGEAPDDPAPRSYVKAKIDAEALLLKLDILLKR